MVAGRTGTLYRHLFVLELVTWMMHGKEKDKSSWDRCGVRDERVAIAFSSNMFFFFCNRGLD